MDLKFNIHDEVSYRQRLAFTWAREGKTRSVSWLFNKIKSGGFLSGVNSEEEARNYCNVIDKYYSVLNRVHGENWDVHLTDSMDIYILNIVIIYPKIKITNSNNFSHTIKDLIVSFSVNMEYSDNRKLVRIGTLKGTRATFSLPEFNSYYSHSHLSSDNRPMNVNRVLCSTDFCLGNGEIVDTRMVLNTNNDPNLFEMFLYNINTLVHWESIEGTPYKYIKNISLYGDSKSTDISSALLEVLTNLILSDIESKRFNPNFIIQGDRYKLKIDEVLHNYIKNKLVELNQTNGTLYKISPENGHILYFSSGYSKRPEDFIINSPNGDYVPFTMIQSKRVPFTILPIKNKDEEFNINEFKVQPKILNYVAEQINAKLYKNAIRESAIRHYSKTCNI